MARIEDSLQTATLTVKLPDPLVLPVQFDESGRMWPGAGLQFMRLLSIAQLDAMGVRFQWQTAKGEVVPREDALRLIEENEQRAAAGQLPTQLNASPTGEA